MRTQHNGTWRRLFISKLCRMRPVWPQSSWKKGQFERPDFTEQNTEKWGGIEGKGHPEPWLKHTRVPTANSRTKKGLILTKRVVSPPFGAGMVQWGALESLTDTERWRFLAERAWAALAKGSLSARQPWENDKGRYNYTCLSQGWVNIVGLMLSCAESHKTHPKPPCSSQVKPWCAE